MLAGRELPMMMGDFQELKDLNYSGSLQNKPVQSRFLKDLSFLTSLASFLVCFFIVFTSGKTKETLFVFPEQNPFLTILAL